MENLRLERVPITNTAMLIRKPAAAVFEAIVAPDITTKFWFAKSSGRLEAGKQVQWDWEMYGISIPVTAKAIVPNSALSSSGRSTVAPPPWNGRSHLTTVRRSSASRRPASLAAESVGEAGDRLDAGVHLGARETQGAPRARRQTRSGGRSLSNGGRSAELIGIGGVEELAAGLDVAVEDPPRLGGLGAVSKAGPEHAAAQRQLRDSEAGSPSQH